MIKKSSINDRLYWRVSNDLTALSNPNNNYQIVVINRGVISHLDVLVEISMNVYQLQHIGRNTFIEI